MKRTMRLLAAPAAALLLLSACSGPDEPTTTEAPAADGNAADSGEEADSAVEDEDGSDIGGSDGEAWELRLADEPFFASTETGAQITMTIDAQPDSNEEIAWLEQYREDAGGEPVSYILSDVDNRDGTEPINMYNISIYDEEGLEWACGSADNYVNEAWRPEWLYLSSDKDEYESADGEPMDYDVAEELERRANEHEYVHGASPFERATMVSICPTVLPETAVAIEVMPQGIMQYPTYALPESYMGEDG